MKHKILSVLGVLLAVILSTAALSACNKAPAGAESGGKNSIISRKINIQSDKSRK